MPHAPTVNIDVEYVNGVIKKLGISGAEFSRTLGYTDNWWNNVKNTTQCIKPNVAQLMCRMYDKLEYEKLVVKKVNVDDGASRPNDSQLLAKLEIIESKLDKLLEAWR